MGWNGVKINENDSGQNSFCRSWTPDTMDGLWVGLSDNPWMREWYQSFGYFQNTFSVVLTRWTIVRITRGIINIMYKCHAYLLVWCWRWCWWRNFDSLLFDAKMTLVSSFRLKFWAVNANLPRRSDQWFLVHPSGEIASSESPRDYSVSSWTIKYLNSRTDCSKSFRYSGRWSWRIFLICLNSNLGFWSFIFIILENFLCIFQLFFNEFSVLHFFFENSFYIIKLSSHICFFKWSFIALLICFSNLFNLVFIFFLL